MDGVFEKLFVPTYMNISLSVDAEANVGRNTQRQPYEDPIRASRKSLQHRVPYADLLPVVKTQTFIKVVLKLIHHRLRDRLQCSREIFADDLRVDGILANDGIPERVIRLKAVPMVFP
jgi:hypothetical protein